MSVIVDTSVWSLAFRRKTTTVDPLLQELTGLIREGRVLMLGSIRQELLSGIKNADQFRKLRDALEAFPDLRLEEADYVDAAKCFNTCRSNGVQGSNTDFLICAAAIRHKATVLTTDGDFELFSRYLHFKLHSAR